jgi:hypothetical protein
MQSWNDPEAQNRVYEEEQRSVSSRISPGDCHPPEYLALQKFTTRGAVYDFDCGNAVMRSFAAAYGMSVIVSSG